MKPLSVLLGLVLPVLLFCRAAPAEIYRWTDEQGKKHFSDHKPEGRKVESFKGKASVTILGDAPISSHSSARVRLFVTQTCPYCRKAKAFLRQRGTPFEELDVEASASANDEFKRLGGSGVPVILVGNQRMDGYDEAELTSLLVNEGL